MNSGTGKRAVRRFYGAIAGFLFFVLDGLHRLGSNANCKAIESVSSQDIDRIGLGGAFRVRVPFH